MEQIAPADRGVATNGIYLHYLDWGDSDKIAVCMHGASGNCHNWDPLARALQPEFRVLALDMRGYGDSDKPETGYSTLDFAADLAGLVEALSIDQFYLIGSAMGSRAATVYTGQHPERVRGLVLVDLSFEMPPDAQQALIDGHLNRPRKFASMDAALAYSQSVPGRQHWTSEQHQNTVTHDVRQLPDGSVELKYRREAAIEAIQRAREDLWPYVAKFACPTILLRGAHSNILTPESARRFSEAVPAARFVEIPRAGHGVMTDNPEAFISTVREFLLGVARS